MTNYEHDNSTIKHPDIFVAWAFAIAVVAGLLAV